MSTVLTLPSMVDLVSTPGEPGIVNYPVLQTLLHVLVQQLGLNKTKVEFRGSDSEKIQESMKKLQESPGGGMEFKVLHNNEAGDKEEESENVILDFHKDSNVDSFKDKKSQESETSYIVESGEIIINERRRGHQVSLTTFTRLETKVKLLQAQVESLGIQAMPSDEILLSKTRSMDQATPISDLWQTINITKRMSGAEEGIDKLASLLETVAKEYAGLKLLLDKVQDELGLDVVETMKEIKLAADYAKKMRPRADLYEKALIKSKSMKETEGSTTDLADKAMSFDDDIRSHVSKTGSSGSTRKAQGGSDGAASKSTVEAVQGGEEGESTTKDEVRSIITDAISLMDEVEASKFRMLPQTNEESVRINNLSMDQELIRRQMEYMMAQINTLADFSEKILPEILEGLPGMEELKKKIAAIRNKTGSQVTLKSADWEIRRTTLTLEQRLEDVESKVASHSSKLRRQDALFCDKYDTVLNVIRNIETTITAIKVKFNLDDSSGDIDNVFDPQTIKMLIDKNTTMANDISDIYNEINIIKIDIDKHEHEFAGVLEEIEGIHSTKVDRFEIDDILADKADCSEVQCKVSTDIFEEFCNSLTKGVDFAIKSTLEQEKQWHKELEKVHEDVDTKFNIIDVDPLRDNLLQKIDELSKRLDQVARMKTYTMAAGSKKRLYTEVNCVACDKKAAMDIIDGSREECDSSAALKPYLNAKPYITYELEQLKKMKIKNPGAKSIQLHEQIMKNYAISVGFDLLPEHEVTFVNRYCGGAETLMNPRQRVARLPKNDNNKCKDR